jgi:hypothetical protein
MADEKTIPELHDKSLGVGAPVVGVEPYEVEFFAKYFADRHGISVDQARELIGTVGCDQDKLDAAARKLKR